MKIEISDICNKEVYFKTSNFFPLFHIDVVQDILIVVVNLQAFDFLCAFYLVIQFTLHVPKYEWYVLEFSDLR